MASRYGNQEERFGGRRGQFRRGESEGRFGRGFERGSEHGGGYSGYGSSRFGRYEDDEGYFGGGGGEGYGQGYTSGWSPSGEWDVGNWRSASFDQPRRRFSGRMSGESDYGDYGYRGESSRGRYTGRSGYYGGTSRGREYDEGGRFGSAYSGSSDPERRRGYMGGREQYEGEDRGWLDRASDEISSWFGDEEAERRREMDARRSGEHRGRGPRGYTRSDDRIKEDINDRLTDYAYIDASDIDVEVNNGEVVLSGNVDSRYEKRLAEDIAEDISGVRNVENRIRVERRQMGEGGWAYTDTAGHTESGRTTRPTTGRGTSSTTGKGAASTTGRSTTATAGGTTGTTTGRGTSGTPSTTGTSGTSSTSSRTRSATGGR